MRTGRSDSIPGWPRFTSRGRRRRQRAARRSRPAAGTPGRSFASDRLSIVWVTDFASAGDRFRTCGAALTSSFRALRLPYSSMAVFGTAALSTTASHARTRDTGQTRSGVICSATETLMLGSRKPAGASSVSGSMWLRRRLRMPSLRSSMSGDSRLACHKPGYDLAGEQRWDSIAQLRLHA